MNPPSTPALSNTARHGLDALEEFDLKAFGTHSPGTPTSGTATLPTPAQGLSPLVNRANGDVAPPGQNADARADWFGSYDTTLIPPGAPYVKDLDSFTEGTGVGSFESLSPASTDEHGNPICPLYEEIVSQITIQQDKYQYIISWQKTLPPVFIAHPPLKRPRSLELCPEQKVRRLRTHSCPSSRHSMAPD